MRPQLKYIFLFSILTSLSIGLSGCKNPLGSKSVISSNYFTGGSSGSDADENPVDPGAPIASSLSSSVNENSLETVIALPHTSEGSDPVSCNVSSPTHLSITTACVCSAGICTLGVQPETDFYGSGSFSFQLTDDQSRASNTIVADITIHRVLVVVSSGDAQSAIVGNSISSPVVALVKNSINEPVSGVSVSWSVTAGGGSVSSCTTTSDSNGLAQCSQWTLGTTAGSNSLQASIFSDQSTDSFSATANPGPATQLVFSSQPSGAVAGVNFTTQPTVTIKDSHGNTVNMGMDASATLTMSLASGTGSLSGTVNEIAVLGIASWSDLSIDAYGTKTLQVDKPDLTGSGGAGALAATSSSFSNATNPPATPSGLSVSAGDGTIGVSWSSVSGASSYNILRGLSAGSLSQIGTSATNSFTDNTVVNGTVYYYAIQSVSAGGTSSSSSSLQGESLSVPSISSVAINDTAGSGALVVTWSASTGATSYSVKYSTNSGSASSGTTGCSVSSPTISCTITGLSADTTYYLVINATNTNSGSVNSSESSGVPRSAPTLSLAASNHQITPTFSASSATSYDLSYGTSSGSYSTTVSSAISGSAITSLINGTTYYFKVVANFSNGSLSSSESSSSPNGPQVFSISTATQGNAQVDLTWGASTDAASYTIKYGTTSGAYSTTFASGVTGTSSTVTGLSNGTTYYFMVTAVNANGSQDATAEFVRTPAQPTLSSISSFSYDSVNSQVVTFAMSSSWSTDMTFTLGGLSSFTCNGTVSASSSNTGVVPNSSLTLSGTYPNCNLNIAVAGGISGSTTITLTATYGSASANQSITIYLLPQPTGVYSTRKAVLGYTGKVMNVRNGTSNAQADVAFDSSTGQISSSSDVTITSVGTSGYNIGDHMTLSSFSSTDNVFVVTWYDQSGGTRNLIQTTTSKQAMIVSTGSLVTLNSKTSVKFSQGQLYDASISTSGNSVTANVIASATSLAGTYRGLVSIAHDTSTARDFNNSNNACLIITDGNASALRLTGYRSSVQMSFTSSALTFAQAFVATSIYNGSNHAMFANGVSNSTVTSTGNFNSLVLRLGARLDSTGSFNYWNGYSSEFTYFESALSDPDRQALEHLQENYFSITGI